MRIIPRAAWDARPPKSRTTTNPGSRRYFVVHHSGAPAGQSVRAIQDWCMNEPPHGRGFADIDYNFLIRSGTGEIYEGRGWDVIGSHAVGFNTNGLGVCVIGDNPVVDQRTAAALAWLYARATDHFDGALTVRGHGQLTGGTDCPGPRLRAFIAAGMPAPEEDDEMTDEQIEKLAKAIAGELMGSPVRVGEDDWKLSTAIGYQTRKAYEIDQNTEPRPPVE